MSTPEASHRVVTAVAGELRAWLDAEVLARGIPRSKVVRDLLEDVRMDRWMASQDQVEALAELDGARARLAEAEAELASLRARLLALADAGQGAA